MAIINRYNIPIIHYGATGIGTANAIFEKLNQKGTTNYRSIYDPEKKHIVVLNSFTVAKCVLHTTLFPSPDSRYFAWIPQIAMERASGNIVIEFNSDENMKGLSRRISFSRIR